MKKWLLFLMLVGSTCFAQETCVAIDHGKLEQRSSLSVLRLWGRESKFWPRSAELRVRFMEGDKRQKSKTWKQFQELDKLCGIAFVLVDEGESEIRVGFRPGKGHWSFIGTDCAKIVQTAQTMNIDLTGWDFESEYARVVKHEAMHALGWAHSTAAPNADIPWRVQETLDYFRRTQGWSAAQTRAQVLNREEANDFFGSAFDPKSIMTYPIPESLVRDKRFATGWNSKMSPTDLEVLRKRYPER